MTANISIITHFVSENILLTLNKLYNKRPVLTQHIEPLTNDKRLRQTGRRMSIQLKFKQAALALANGRGSWKGLRKGNTCILKVNKILVSHSFNKENSLFSPFY